MSGPRVLARPFLVARCFVSKGNAFLCLSAIPVWVRHGSTFLALRTTARVADASPRGPPRPIGGESGVAWAVRRNFLDGRGFQPTASLDGHDHDRGEPNEEGHTGV